MEIYTTLKQIKDAKPCDEGWKKFRKNIDRDFPNDRRIYVSDALLAGAELSDLLWGLTRAVSEAQKAYVEKCLVVFACDCAERVLPLFEKDFPKDKRPRLAIDIARTKDFSAAKATAVLAAATLAYSAALPIPTYVGTQATLSASYAARAAHSVICGDIYVSSHVFSAASYAVDAVYSAICAAAYSPDVKDKAFRKIVETRKAEEKSWQMNHLMQCLSGKS